MKLLLYKYTEIGECMKKIIFVVCVGLCSVGVGAQPQHAKMPLSKQNTFQVALERQVAHAQHAAQVTVEPGRDINHEHPASVPSPDKPTYFVTEEAYKTCASISICKEWATQQAKQEVHFQVLDTTLGATEDLHHSRLVIKYVTYQDVQEKIFEENFDGWKEI